MKRTLTLIYFIILVLPHKYFIEECYRGAKWSCKVKYWMKLKMGKLEKLSPYIFFCLYSWFVTPALFFDPVELSSLLWHCDEVCSVLWRCRPTVWGRREHILHLLLFSSLFAFCFYKACLYFLWFQGIFLVSKDGICCG